jgi:5-oxoprolinase (ATP-hydrolysing)/N-methylhydantoinase A
MTVSVVPEGVEAPIDGLFGGSSGLLAHGCVRDAAGEIIHDFGTGGLYSLDRTDLTVELQLAGGSGFGEPSERPVEAIEVDRRQGYISTETAERVYALGARRKHSAGSPGNRPAFAGVQEQR